METGSRNHGDVEARQSIAVVHECLIAQGRDRETLLLVSRNNEGDSELEEEESGVDLPSVRVRTCILTGRGLSVRGFR